MAVKLRMVLVQIADRVAEASVAHSRQSSEGSGTKSFQDLPSCWGYHVSLFPNSKTWYEAPGSGEGSAKFRKVPAQMADEVPEGSGADG